MTTSFTPNVALALQGTGDNSNTWGTILNASDFTIIDQVLGSKFSLSVAGSADVTLSTSNSQNLYFNFTGILTGNINVIFPAAAGRLIIVTNATTGTFTLTVKPSGGTGFLVTQGSTQLVQIDGTAGIAQAPQNNILPFEVTLASATTTDLGSTGTNVVAISGTTAITGFGSAATITECLYFIRFTGILTLTYNATSLIIPGAANITTAAGDSGIAQYLGSGNWKIINYTVAASPPGGLTASSVATLTNKTYDTAGAGNSFLINSVPITVVPQFRTPIIFTSGTTWTTPANITAATLFKITLVGGGGGALGGSGPGGGASAGAVAIWWINGLTASTGYTYAIGAAGAAGSSGAGGNGGATSLIIGATTVTANGGVGSSSTQAPSGNAATNGTININGGSGGNGSGTAGGNGGNNLYGYGGYGGTNNTNGLAGTGFGGGGGGTGAGSATLGGAGAAGAIIIEYVW